AIRTPARVAMLWHAGSQTGLGFAFGLHGALDQTGAILGPMIVAAAFYLKSGYQTGFAILAIPAVLAMLVLLAARHTYPHPRDLVCRLLLEKKKNHPRRRLRGLGEERVSTKNCADVS